MLLRLLLLLSGLWAYGGGVTAAISTPDDQAAVRDAKPVLLYRIGPRGKEAAHLPDKDYSQALAALRLDFEARPAQAPLTSGSLAGVNLLFIVAEEKAAGAAPPAPLISPEEIDAIASFVAKGGGMLFLQGDEESCAGRPSARLLARLGVSAGPARIGAKALSLPSTLPLLGGLRWATYGMPPLDFLDEDAEHPPVVVMNDLRQASLDPKDCDYEGAVMLWKHHAQGRIAVVAGTKWAKDPALDGSGFGDVRIPEQDNREILRRLARWAAGLPKLPPHSNPNP